MSKKRIVIIGNNTSAFLNAFALSSSGHDVTLVDRIHTTESTPNPLSLSEIEAVQSDAITFEAAAWLESVLQTSTLTHEVTLQPATIEEAATKPFLGFGDATYKNIPPLSTFNVSNLLQFKPLLSQLIANLRSKKNFKVIPYSEVTAINDLDQNVKSIVLNGQQTVEADAFIFTGHPKELSQFLPADTLGTRVKGKIAKTQTWSELRVVFQHQEPLFVPGHVIFLLPPSIRNEPFIGQFQAIEGENRTEYRSVWQTYFDNDLSEDPDAVSSTLKHMKKTLAKAFPQSNEFTKEQIIAVNSDGYADFSWAAGGFGFEDDLKNFFIASSLMTPFTGLIGSVVAAESTIRKVQSLLDRAPAEKETSTPSLLSSSHVAELGTSC